MFKKYINYLRNNPKDYWFKRKLFVWGWVPVKWQGWLVTTAFVVFIIWAASNPSESIWFSIEIIVAVVLLLAICYKTGERPRWQWGVPKEPKDKDIKQI